MDDLFFIGNYLDLEEFVQGASPSELWDFPAHSAEGTWLPSEDSEEEFERALRLNSR